jgi:1-acyl-sn-glycerol-3-phosphate acyltransferase
MGFSETFLKLNGWKYEGAKPSPKKWVGLAVPHTSNWDGLLLVLLAQSIGLDMKWMIKGDWVNGPMGAVLRNVGAMAIDRTKANNVVQAMIDEMNARDEFVLVIPPEGTRKKVDTWKSGFYHIARGANVPVCPGYLDYGRKVGGFGEPITMTGDVKADMDKIRAFYAQQAPRPYKPSAFGPIRLREETA